MTPALSVSTYESRAGLLHPWPALGALPLVSVVKRSMSRQMETTDEGLPKAPGLSLDYGSTLQGSAGAFRDECCDGVGKS